MKNQGAQKGGNIILTACVLFNLSIGVLYAWSVMKARLSAPIAEGGWGWTSTQAGLPYTIAIIVFATAMLIGGKIQDKIGPRWVVTAGGVFAGAGIMLSGLVGNNPVGVALCFGVIYGIGMGFGYGCVTPPALKWFHPSKKGLISGLIVGGFGLSAVYFAPLANALLGRFDIEQTFIFLGAGVLVVGVLLAQLIKNPPAGYTPQAPRRQRSRCQGRPRS